MSTPEPAEVPLWAPRYDARFGTSISRFWRKYATFSGRATRAEYWWSYLFVAIGYAISLTLLYGPLFAYEAAPQGSVPPLFIIGVFLTVGWLLATAVPWLALESRRMHDANLSSLFLLLHLLTWPGAIAVFVMCQLNPNPLGRRFDAPPGEPARFARVADWPAAPGEPENPYTVRVYSAPAPVSEEQPPSL